MKKRQSLPGRKTDSILPKQPRPAPKTFLSTLQQGSQTESTDRELLQGPRRTVEGEKTKPGSCRENRKLCPPLKSLPILKKKKTGGHSRVFKFCLVQEDMKSREFCPRQNYPREIRELRRRGEQTRRDGILGVGLRKRNSLFVSICRSSTEGGEDFFS